MKKNEKNFSDTVIYEKNVSDQKELIQTLRNKINKWANSIEYHPYKNLGDKITVDELWYKPAYPVTYRTQYEFRSKNKGYVPYTGQTIPKLEIIELSDFNAWDIKLQEINQFTNDISDYIVNGSQTVDNCFHCSAKGWITCVRCYGNKTVTCPTCGGARNVTCTSCSGKGYNRCSSCGGQGYRNTMITKTRQVWVPESTAYGSKTGGYYRTESYQESSRERCSYCSGTGQNRCNTCGATGKVTCSRCNGRGSVTCPVCSGTGRNTCPECKGHQQLMHYFYVKRNLSFTKQYANIIHGSVFDAFPEFKDKCDSFESNNIHSKRMDLFPDNYLSEDNHLARFVEEMVVKARAEKKNNQNIQFQQLDINKIDAWELHYTFNSKEYVMVFYGDEYEIIQGKSPIYEVALEYWDKAVKAYKLRNYSRAWELINKANKIETYEDQESIQQSLDMIQEKLESSYTFGSTLGGWLSAFFLSFISYSYFAKVNWVFDYAGFINDPDNFLFGYHTVANALAIFALGLLGGEVGGMLTKKLHAIIPLALGRFVIGLVAGIFFSIVLAVLWGLLNATGITILVTFTLWAVWWLVKIVLYAIGIVIGLTIFVVGLAWDILKWIWGLFF